MQLPGSSQSGSAKGTSAALVARLPQYLRILDRAHRLGEHTLSSDEIAKRLDGTSAKIRKDLSQLGFTGTRGVGYDVAALRYQIAEVLGLIDDRPVAIVGMGNLGKALAAYPGFRSNGFRVAAAFDEDESLIGTTVGQVPIHASKDIGSVVARQQIRMALIAVPAPAAQSVARRLVDAGVVSILNFAPVNLQVPSHVEVRRSDLLADLQILAFHDRFARPTAAITS